MKDLRDAMKILEMEINRDMPNFCLFAHQTPYVLKNFEKIWHG